MPTRTISLTHSCVSAYRNAVTRFGAWLVTQRTERDWSRGDLARFIRSAPSQVARWETGDSLPSLAKFSELVRVLCIADVKEVLRLVPAQQDDDAAAA